MQAQQALELLELRKAEGDLLVALSSISVCASAALAFAVYLTSFVFSENYTEVSSWLARLLFIFLDAHSGFNTQGNWASLEAALFTIQWLVTCVFVLSFMVLIFNELHIRPKGTTEPAPVERLSERIPMADFANYRIGSPNR